MIIHTKNWIPKSVKTTESTEVELNIINERESLLDILKIKDKIIHSLEKGAKTAKELSKELSIASRTIRKNLNILRIEGIVKRDFGERINNSFRYSDKWEILKNPNLNLEVPKNMICVWYKSPYPIGAFRYNYIFLPKKIEINEELLVSFGFFVAEGSKTKFRAIEITNSEPELIKTFLKSFYNFDIKKSMWRWRIVFNRKFRNFLNEESINNLEISSKNFWLETCKLYDKNFINFVYSGQKSGKIRKGSPTWGTLNIQYNNALFAGIMMNFFENIKPLALENNELAINYLRGYLSGEAYVGTRDREIQIGSKNKNELIFCKFLLEKIGVRCSLCKSTTTSPPRIIITNLDSFLTLNEYDIFKFHPYKKKNLLTKLLNYRNLEKSSIKDNLEKINDIILQREVPFKPFIEKIFT